MLHFTQQTDAEKVMRLPEEHDAKWRHFFLPMGEFV